MPLKKSISRPTLSKSVEALLYEVTMARYKLPAKETAQRLGPAGPDPQPGAARPK